MAHLNLGKGFFCLKPCFSFWVTEEKGLQNGLANTLL